MDRDPETQEIVRIIVMLAHGLGLRVVAEGVETEEQSDLLKQIGCELAQGYLFSKPASAETIEDVLASNRAENQRHLMSSAAGSSSP
jgi:EAL domain-containing protein (putative c-di-GMP-specific phosphodiesterase class I)